MAFSAVVADRRYSRQWKNPRPHAKRYIRWVTTPVYPMASVREVCTPREFRVPWGILWKLGHPMGYIYILYMPWEFGESQGIYPVSHGIPHMGTRVIHREQGLGYILCPWELGFSTGIFHGRPTGYPTGGTFRASDRPSILTAVVCFRPFEVDLFRISTVSSMYDLARVAEWVGPVESGRPTAGSTYCLGWVCAICRSCTTSHNGRGDDLLQ